MEGIEMKEWYCCPKCSGPVIGNKIFAKDKDGNIKEIIGKLKIDEDIAFGYMCLDCKFAWEVTD